MPAQVTVAQWAARRTGAEHGDMDDPHDVLGLLGTGPFQRLESTPYAPRSREGV